MSTPDPATTSWVPLWDLNGGVNLEYKGAWAAGTYKDGDVVVHQGVSYLCVRSTTKAPTPWQIAPGMVTSYGTTLPASPYDGQEAILVDSTTNPNYQWRFRYNAQSVSPYKWEFVGGHPAVSGPTGTWANVGTTDWADLPDGPVLTVPRLGQYSVNFGAFLQNSGSFSGAYEIQIKLLAGAAPSVVAKFVASGQFAGANVAQYTFFSPINAGATVKMQVWTQASLSNILSGWINITPRCVS